MNILIEAGKAVAMLGGPLTMFFFTWWAFPSRREQLAREAKRARRMR